ncbi:hypothetical protein ACJMK2_019855 [Sinanodonta woodiana]|uniref:PHD-type domain-containing protein n=1 Tax=Sinanodonta woodiana TaxID=1069815 RepID=A0ABD3TZP9_SINWO
MKKNHTNFLVRSSGLFIHITHSEIGASPDVIISCVCCGIGSLEIKCPYTIRDMDLNCNGGLTLDRRHGHYYQVQCQLFVCDTKIMQTLNAMNCYTRLLLQNSKGATPGQSSAIEQLSESTSLPLHNSKATLGPSNVAHQSVWCFCQDDEYGQMVACDDQNCRFQWFHFDCVGITSKPKGKWYCPLCIQSCSKSRISKVK